MYGKLWKLLRGKEVDLGFIKVHSTSLITGITFVVLGILIFSGTLYSFNRIVATLDLQQWFFGIEEQVLQRITQ